MGFIHANLFQMVEYLDDLQRVWNKVSEMQAQLAGGASLDEVGKTSRALDQISQEIDFDFIKSDFTKAVRESQEGSERIRHIVRDLRDFSHHDTVESMQADLNQCLDSTANIVWTMMKHSVVLKKDYCELPPLRCFPMQLKQVFMNLLVNAYQAIEDVAAEPGVVPEIEVKTEIRGDSIVVSIRDEGVGIAAEDLKRIFDPFFTTKEVGAGTGLGLSTSYNIVKRHSGEIRVESEIGKGTVFEVHLPVAGVDEVQSGV
jgi:two-component system NtrC family sensor kinase